MHECLRVTVLSLLCIHSNAMFAWSCPDFDKEMQGIEEHIDLASHVFLAEVTEGQFDLKADLRYYSHIYVKFSIHEMFKGDEKDHIVVSADVESLVEPISIGYSYIVFLYGEDYLNSVCGFLIPMGYAIQTFESMEHWSGLISDSHSQDRSAFIEAIRKRRNSSQAELQ